MTQTQGRTQFCNTREIRDVMTHLQREGTYFLAGAHSIYVPAGKKRYVDKTVCKPWPDIDGQVGLQTPGQAARTEMLREWPELKKIGWTKGHVTLLDWRSPLFYIGPVICPMVYIDLDAAYSQIYERLWLDTSYPRGYYGQYPMANVARRLRVWKMARNSIAGITRSRDGVAYRGTRRIALKFKNKYLSPGLWASIQTVLHWIMGKAIECGAIYGNVDGYIFACNNWNHIEEFTEWLANIEIKWSVRAAGDGEIVCWNNYSIGKMRTKSNALNLTHKSKEFTNVRTVDEERWGEYWRNCGKIAGTNADTGGASYSPQAGVYQAHSRDRPVQEGRTGV